MDDLDFFCNQNGRYTVLYLGFFFSHLLFLRGGVTLLHTTLSYSS